MANGWLLLAKNIVYLQTEKAKNLEK